MKKVRISLFWATLICLTVGISSFKQRNTHSTDELLYQELSNQKNILEDLFVDHLSSKKGSDYKKSAIIINELQSLTKPDDVYYEKFDELFGNSSNVRMQLFKISAIIKEIKKSSEFSSLTVIEKNNKLAQLVSLNIGSIVERVVAKKKTDCYFNCTFGYAAGLSNCSQVAYRFVELAYPQEFADAVMTVCGFAVAQDALQCYALCDLGVG